MGLSLDIQPPRFILCLIRLIFLIDYFQFQYISIYKYLYLYFLIRHAYVFFNIKCNDRVDAYAFVFCFLFRM